MDNYFDQLNQVNVNDKKERKGNLIYLSWAYAWAEVKKRFPDATYTIYENDLGWNYHTDNTTCWVKTGVTINGIEHIEYLPVMDNRNRSIFLSNLTSFDVNKAIQRSLTKACARHGLGLYIYAGEDLPEEPDSKDQVADIPDKELDPETYKAVKITQEQEEKLVAFLDEKRKSVDAFCDFVGIENIKDLTQYEYSFAMIGKFEEVKKMRNKK